MRNVLAALLLLQAALPATAEGLAGRVVGIADGDTLFLQTGWRQAKIRLAEIDAPEHSQAFGEQSKQSLAGLALGKTVRVEPETIDKYGRIVGTVFAGGLNLNQEQVRRGMAWAYRQYLRDPDYLRLEQEARRAKAGLWSADREPPWQYRHERSGQDSAEPANTKPSTGLAGFSCADKQYCGEMSSCEEAKFYLNQCGLSRLDRDRDGVPCESLCNPSQ